MNPAEVLERLRQRINEARKAFASLRWWHFGFWPDRVIEANVRLWWMLHATPTHLTIWNVSLELLMEIWEAYLEGARLVRPLDWATPLCESTRAIGELIQGKINMAEAAKK